MELFDLRLELSKYKKSKPWMLKDLENVLNSLKNDKARDPNGWVNEIFKTGVAGMNLKLSMLKLFNKIKTENHIQEFMRKADVTTIYKGKGEKSDLNNDRGIFLVTIFRCILMKLIYNDTYEDIDDAKLDLDTEIEIQRSQTDIHRGRHTETDTDKDKDMMERRQS